MSIITEALKKAEKERNSVVTSREYMEKILGPERRGTYQPQVFESGKKAADISRPLDDDVARQRKRGIIKASGLAMIVAIIFLALTNIYLITPLDLDTAIKPVSGIPVEAEPYTDMSSEIRAVEQIGGQKDVFDVMGKEAVRRLFFSRFNLNGIVYDVGDSWAIINNSVVRTGDTFNGAKILAIEPKKVTMRFRNEIFHLVVK